MEAIATAHRERNTGAIYAFKLQRNRRIFVQSGEFVAKVQLTARSIRSSGKPRHAWPTVPKVGRCLFVQSRRLFVPRHEDCGEVNQLLDEHIGHVAQRIRELRALEKDLKALRARCSSPHPIDECGILNQLDSAAAQGPKAATHRHIRGSH